VNELSEDEMLGLDEKIVAKMEKKDGMGLAVELCGAVVNVSEGFETGLVG
jgi:hypothetical protein